MNEFYLEQLEQESNLQELQPLIYDENIVKDEYEFPINLVEDYNYMESLPYDLEKNEISAEAKENNKRKIEQTNLMQQMEMNYNPLEFNDEALNILAKLIDSEKEKVKKIEVEFSVAKVSQKIQKLEDRLKEKDEIIEEIQENMKALLLNFTTGWKSVESHAEKVEEKIKKHKKKFVKERDRLKRDIKQLTTENESLKLNLENALTEINSLKNNTSMLKPMIENLEEVVDMCNELQKNQTGLNEGICEIQDTVIELCNKPTLLELDVKHYQSVFKENKKS